MKGVKALILSVSLLALVAVAAVAYKLASRPAEADVGPLVDAPLIEVPFIFWGGDVATFHANGGLETTPDSIFGKQGLKVKLIPGDDFVGQQVKDYMSGKSPFLRGTLSMLGQVSEQLTAQSNTTPVVFLQLTWSAGDHLVGREGFKTLSDLKGKKIALQKGGPHVGMLHDILRTTRLNWNDITVVWTEEVNGDKGPAALMRKDPTVDACFAISPEMFDLTSAPETGGVDSVGDGTKKSIKGAHVVVSTAHMSRSIADVYACRKDFYDKNKPLVERFAAGYLKACEELIDAKKKAGEKDKAAKDRYDQDIKLAQEIWGKDPAFKDAVQKADDVDGLISDAAFVGLPGNESFFTATGNLSGFPFKQAQAAALPEDPSTSPLKLKPKLFLAADFKYNRLREIGKLHGKAPSQPRIRAEAKIVAENTIFEFKILFQPNESKFSAAKYGDDFQRALEQASLFGNTIVAIRGHADPGLLIQRFVAAATAQRILKEEKGGYVLKGGNKLDLGDTKAILAVIEANPNLTFTDQQGTGTLAEAVRKLQNLSKERADEVRNSVTSYANMSNLMLDDSQMRIEAVGVRDSVNPTSDEISNKNRRVEFRIIKVPVDQVNADEFDL